MHGLIQHRFNVSINDIKIMLSHFLYDFDNFYITTTLYDYDFMIQLIKFKMSINLLDANSEVIIGILML